VATNHTQAPTQNRRRLIEVEAIIVAYAMSRLDRNFMGRFHYNSWREAFDDVGRQLGVPPASMKNLRDEFDPFHGNPRKGWHKRALRPNRQRVLGEFCDASDDAVAEVVTRILKADKEVRKLITKPIASSRSHVQNVAERLRTGRLAEEYFVAHSEKICGFSASELIDCRFDARGFDFGVASDGRLGIEVKGLKSLRGEILFTDYEWRQAVHRKSFYWLVVVALLRRSPRAILIKDPSVHVPVVSTIRKSIVISWKATVAVA